MEKILIAEDSRIVQARLRDILGDSYSLTICSDGPAAVTTATEAAPDLVLLDIHLPGMDGYEVCRILKGYEPTADIPVIFITSLDTEEERLKGFDAGGEDYITKPFFPKELLARIRVHLDSRKVRSQALELEKHRLFRGIALSLAHEVNTPIASAYASLFLLEKEMADSEAASGENLRTLKTSLELIRDAIRRFPKAAEHF